MKNRILTVATIIGLSMIFASCEKGANRAEVTPDAPAVDPWEGYEKTPDGTRIILPEPITLDISVAPTRVVNNTLRADIGDFDGIYSEDERARATVNTPEPADRPTAPRNPYSHGTAEFWQWYYSDEYRAYQREFDRWQSWNTNGGEDWIRDLHIPELREGDYKVDGLVPYSDFGRFSTGVDVTPYSKVTITFYKLPTSGVLSFMVNSKAYHTYYNRDENLAPLTLENPFLISENPDFSYEQDVVSKRKWLDSKNIFPGSDLGGNSQLFESSYLPMFSRLVDVKPNDKRGIDGRESGSTEPVHEIRSIYLERAVAKVTVRWEYEYYPAGSTKEVNPVKDHFFDDIYPGQYANITSVVPNNWAALKSHYEKVGKPAANMPFYRSYPNIAYIDDESVGTALMRGGTEHFYMPENFPTNASEQATMLVYITKFDPATNAIVGKRRYKYYEIPFGTKRADGLREIRRNHSYEILLRFTYPGKGTGDLPHGPLSSAYLRGTTSEPFFTAVPLSDKSGEDWSTR
ncbi:hypothetical protein [uncultured Porphyromonas sp.]|uniref:hypothetical protein n=1 Tax=uncultured Porphyromonas sp. TaxID=159274 RepID=UPI002599E2DE|nr:hypothetical protein [uncultured Porphyromonas sp.]